LTKLEGARVPGSKESRRFGVFIFDFRKEWGMTEREKMVCPTCGVEMNRHAEKIDYAAEAADDEAFDSELGGVVEEFHTCPSCGRTLARRAA
jgi:ribosomal protein L37AE/L43A